MLRTYRFQITQKRMNLDNKVTSAVQVDCMIMATCPINIKCPRLVRSSVIVF